MVANEFDDEDTREGLIFKRQREVVAVTSNFATNGRPPSFRDNPPDASSSRTLLTLEGGGDSTPKDDQVPPAPELSAVLQYAIKSFQEKGAAKALDGDMLRERMGHDLGEFLAHSSTLMSQAEARMREELALVEARMKEELAQQARVFAIRETALTQELSSLRQSKKDTKKQLFDKGQEVVQLEAKILPLHTRVIELEEQAEETKAKMAKLEERATNQEVQLGRVEGELAQQAKTFKKTEVELIEDAVAAYGAGFEDALAQVACVHIEMDTSPFATSKQVVDGHLVPGIPLA